MRPRVACGLRPGAPRWLKGRCVDGRARFEDGLGDAGWCGHGALHLSGAEQLGFGAVHRNIQTGKFSDTFCLNLEQC